MAKLLKFEPKISTYVPGPLRIDSLTEYSRDKIRAYPSILKTSIVKSLASVTVSVIFHAQTRRKSLRHLHSAFYRQQLISKLENQRGNKEAENSSSLFLPHGLACWKECRVRLSQLRSQDEEKRKRKTRRVCCRFKSVETGTAAAKTRAITNQFGLTMEWTGPRARHWCRCRHLVSRVARVRRPPTLDSTWWYFCVTVLSTLRLHR